MPWNSTKKQSSKHRVTRLLVHPTPSRDRQGAVLKKHKMILTPTSGFIKQAGFTHSLTPARNCTFGCTYCYVPTMRIQAGLKKQIIYRSPLTDPYQPAEEQAAGDARHRSSRLSTVSRDFWCTRLRAVTARERCLKITQ